MTPTDKVIEAARAVFLDAYPVADTESGDYYIVDRTKMDALEAGFAALDATPDESVVVTVWYQGSGMSLLDTSRRPTAWPHGTRLRITVEEGEGEP